MNSDGITPVMWACMYQKNPAVIDTLIELGGDINDKKHSGQYSPLDWAYKCNRSHEVCNHIKEIG
jgi:ankyrin repeat protein